MRRRSARVKQQRRDENTVTPAGDEDVSPGASSSEKDDDDFRASDAEGASDYEAPRPRKVVLKKVRRTHQRRAGKLRQMLDMPLDVILEICTHLHPRDLLHLARASKELRRFFMSRSSRSIWKAAISSLLDLPPCPDDISEPAYINLVFSTHCHVCLRGNCQELDWPARMRVCNACHKSPDAWAYLGKKVAAMIAPYDIRDLVLPVRLYYPQVYGPSLKKFAQDLKETPIQERAEFLRKRKEVIKSRHEGYEEITTYLSASKYVRTIELERQRVARRKQIIERLKQAGYDAEVDYIMRRCLRAERQKFIMMPEVRKPQALTPKIWGNIEARVLSFFAQVRENRMAADRKDTIIKRLNVLEKLVRKLTVALNHRLLYTCEVVFNISGIVEFLDPHLEEFDPEAMKRVLDEKALTYVEDRDRRHREALGLFIKGELGLESSADPFALAAAAYLCCSRCSHQSTLDEALQHRCIGQTVPKPCGDVSSEIFTSFIAWYMRGNMRNVTWTPDWALYSPGLHKAAEIIEMCGLDPKTATAHDMDAACGNMRMLHSHKDSYSPFGYAAFMDWRAALYNRHHFPSLRKVTEEETFVAAPLEAALEREREEKRVTYRCLLCDKSRREKKEVVVRHFRIMHDHQDPDIDNYIGTDTSIPGFVYLFLPKDRDPYGERSFIKDKVERGIATYFDFSDAQRTTTSK